MSDSAEEHFVLKGETFILGKWISAQMEHKKFVQYKEAKVVEDALINVAEVFYTDVAMNDKLQMDIYQYRTLCCAV